MTTSAKSTTSGSAPAAAASTTVAGGTPSTTKSATSTSTAGSTPELKRTTAESTGSEPKSTGSHRSGGPQDQSRSLPVAEPAVPIQLQPKGAPVAETTWKVEPGDHFWHIAETTLADRFGKPPADAETVRYWRRLIEVNRGELVDSDNPDLILPGQIFVLPDVGS